MVVTVIKTEELCMPWEELEEYLIIGRSVADVKVA